MTDVFVFKNGNFEKIAKIDEDILHEIKNNSDPKIEYKFEHHITDKNERNRIIKLLKIDRQTIKNEILKIIGTKFYSLSRKRKEELILYFQMNT